MGFIRAAYNRSGIGDPPQLDFLNGKSTTIADGDLVVMTTGSSYTTASNPVVRSMVQDEIDDLYESPVAGVLGCAKGDYVTNSSGIANGQSVFSAKGAAAEPVLSLPSYNAGVPVDPNIGYTKMMVYLALPGVVFRGKLSNGNSGLAAMTNLGLGPAGFLISSGNYYVDTNATTKIIDIIGWDTLDTSICFFEFKAAYCQILTGVWYAD